MEIFEEYEIERLKYWYDCKGIDTNSSFIYRVNYSYLYFDEEMMGDDEFYETFDFQELQYAIEFKELLEKVKSLDIPKLNNSTYLVGDVKIYKVVFETHELIM